MKMKWSHMRLEKTRNYPKEYSGSCCSNNIIYKTS